MKRLVRSEGYARVRLVSAAFFIVLGTAIVARTLLLARMSPATVPGCVLGLAMLALGVVRVRDYLANRMPS